LPILFVIIFNNLSFVKNPRKQLKGSDCWFIFIVIWPAEPLPLLLPVVSFHSIL